MPQFDTIFFESQIFWTVISFVILFVVLNRWVLPPITKILNKRAQLINKEMTDARLIRVEAEDIKARYYKQLEEIKDDADLMVAEAEERISKKHQQMMDEFEQETQRRKKAAIQDEQLLQQKALEDIRSESSKLIVAATEQLIHHKFDEDDAQRELDQIIIQLQQELHSESTTDKDLN